MLRALFLCTLCEWLFVYITLNQNAKIWNCIFVVNSQNLSAVFTDHWQVSLHLIFPLRLCINPLPFLQSLRHLFFFFHYPKHHLQLTSTFFLTCLLRFFPPLLFYCTISHHLPPTSLLMGFYPFLKFTFCFFAPPFSLSPPVSPGRWRGQRGQGAWRDPPWQKERETARQEHFQGCSW